MPLPASLHFAFADPDAAPITLNQFITLLNQLGSVTIEGDFAPYILGAVTPAVDDQDKVWHKLDGAGRPIGTFVYYNGLWRRMPTGRKGDIKYFSGNPSTYFDDTGLGIPGGDQDGWALANGQNGTANLSNLFLVGGAMDNDGLVGFSGGLWHTNVGGGSMSTGGATTITLDAANTYRPATDARGPHDIWMADGNVRDAGGDLWGTPASSGDENVVPADAGNPTPDPIPIVPPFYAMAILGYVGIS